MIVKALEQHNVVIAQEDRIIIIATEPKTIVKAANMPGGNADPIWNANRIKGILIDDTNIAHSRILVYDSASRTLRYQNQPSGGSGGGGGIPLPLSANKRGFNCSGIDTSSGRQLVLENISLTTDILVWVNGIILHEPDISIQHANEASVVTFLNPLDDIAYIKVLAFMG